MIFSVTKAIPTTQLIVNNFFEVDAVAAVKAKNNGSVKLKDRPKRIDYLRAVEGFVGSRVALAKMLGVSRHGIDRWHHTGKIPSQHIIELVRISEGKFTAEDFLA